MKKIFNWRTMSMSAVAASLVVLAAGSVEPNEPNSPNQGSSANEALGIPSDESATEAPKIEDSNVNVANPSIVVETEKGHDYVAINLTGVWNEEAAEWLKLFGTGTNKQNLWVTVDDVPKGVDVYNNSEETDDSKKLIADVVFLVDNSGSMYEEAEAVASSIMEWSAMLSESGLDLRVGCVGYGDSYKAIDGAINICTSEELNTWMQNNGGGTDRTHKFGGDDADHLRALANGNDYDNGPYNECGMVALHYAHDNFKFRSGSNRIYVNFTDEPNQPYNISKWSVEYLNPENGNWNTNYGTVHTVFSEDKDYWNFNPNWEEEPWLMSDYTGGTTLYTDRYFTDFTLKNIPVTGAMQNSYILRIANIAAYFDGQEHKVTITVYDNNGKIRAEKTVYFVFGTK